MDLIVTIDTEADDQWCHGRPLTCDNVAWWEPFQRLCEGHGVPPTYLVTSEMAENEQARALLRGWVQEGRAEVGAHLHAWTTPPFRDEPGLRFNDVVHAYEWGLPEDLLRGKIDTLTGQIETAIGVRPRCYRAGRFGMGLATARILTGLGYIVDSSVTPYVTWTGLRETSPWTRPPDFRHHSAAPFVVEATGRPGLLELPVTIVLSSRIARLHPALAAAYLSVPGKAMRRIVRLGRRRPEPVWLRPFRGQEAGDLTRAWRTAADMCLPAAVMMFHSSELMPGGSPHRPTARSVDELLTLLDGFFAFALAEGARPTTLTRAAERILTHRTPGEKPL